MIYVEALHTCAHNPGDAEKSDKGTRESKHFGKQKLQSIDEKALGSALGIRFEPD